TAWRGSFSSISSSAHTMPAEIERTHEEVREFERIEAVSDSMRNLIEGLWPELVPPTMPAARVDRGPAFFMNGGEKRRIKRRRLWRGFSAIPAKRDYRGPLRRLGGHSVV